jgi:iron complex outermembrane receptor protein
MVLAQLSISGKISGNNNVPLAGANVKLKGKGFTSTSNADGIYEFANLKAGNYTIVVSYLGYANQEKSITLNANQTVDFVLELKAFLADEVVVNATRANKNSPTTYRNMDKKEIDKNNVGQDLPYILNQTPSVVVTSDAGAGVGYTGLRIRGSDAARVNVTLNGIPLNDAESQGSFFVNLPDLASSVDNIQVQRGVGTSTNGAGAFGASLNIQTTTRRDSAYAELNNTYGSYDTWKNTVSVGSGLIANKFTFDGRLSRIKSDGYMDNAFANLKSYFVTGAYYGKKDILRANVFSGTEKTYQAWYGVYANSEDELKDSKTRRAAYFTYDNQTDNYQQDHYQLFYTRTLSDKLTANAALHYTKGRGYYEEFVTADSLKAYKIDPLVVNGQLQETSDLVRRLWLDNDFYGTTYSLAYTPSNKLSFTLGGAYNRYQGKHFDEVIWAQYANYDASGSLRHRYDDNDAFKSDFNVFGRANYQLDKLNIFADLQYRNVFYSFFGVNVDGSAGQQSARLEFFNPKFGLTYDVNANSNVYASVAVGHKEPKRDDFVSSTVNSRPKPEQLVDFEAGYRVTKDKFSVGANGFAMLYKDQLINTGKLNDVGASINQNVPDSYRLGIELDGKYQILKNLYWVATATLSRNKIKEFTEYIYDGVEATTDPNYGNVQINTYSNTNISFSPSFIGSTTIGFSPIKNGEIAFISKYVSKQYLDNSSDNTRQLDKFFINDIRLSYSLAVAGIKNLALSLLINNVFNEKYVSNGYTFPELKSGELNRYNAYYPQATTNFLLSLNLKF